MRRRGCPSARRALNKRPALMYLGLLVLADRNIAERLLRGEAIDTAISSTEVISSGPSGFSARTVRGVRISRPIRTTINFFMDFSFLHAY